MFDRLNSGAAESPSSMSLGRVMDSMNAVRSRSGSGGSDRASSRDTITVSSNPGNNPNIKHNPSSKRASMIDERDRSEGDMRQQSYDIDGGNTNEQQNLKRRRVDDQMSS